MKWHVRFTTVTLNALTYDQVLIRFSFCIEYLAYLAYLAKKRWRNYQNYTLFKAEKKRRYLRHYWSN